MSEQANLTWREKDGLAVLDCRRPDLLAPKGKGYEALYQGKRYFITREGVRFVKRMVAHMDEACPDCTNYNVWYAAHTARSRGHLDSRFEPVDESNVICAEEVASNDNTRWKRLLDWARDQTGA